MFSKTIVSLLTLVLAAGAMPSKRATCSKGRTASNQQVGYYALIGFRARLTAFTVLRLVRCP